MKISKCIQLFAACALAVCGVFLARAAQAGGGWCPSNVEALCNEIGEGGICGEECAAVYAGSYCPSVPPGQEPICTGTGEQAWGAYISGTGNLASGNFIYSSGTTLAANLGATGTDIQHGGPWMCVVAIGLNSTGQPTCVVNDTNDDGSSVYNAAGSCGTPGRSDYCWGNCTGSTGFVYEQEYCIVGGA